MKKFLISFCASMMLFCSFTTASTGPKNPKVGKRSAEKFMLGFEVFRGSDNSPLNHTDIKIEIYDHTEQKTIFKRDYTEMPTNKYSSVTYFENMKYGNNLTLLIQAPNFFAKEINISYEEGCTQGTKFCVNGLNNPPYEINGEYGDRYIFPVTLDSITIGEELTMPNIYYQYNSAELQPRSFWILDSLSKVIEHNPELQIELGGHADARGQDAYNMDLSQRRVNSAKDYLMKKLGKDVGERMTAVGYGETRLINDCGNGVDCGEDAHQENRRTTLKINRLIKEAANLTLEQRMELRKEKMEIVAAN